MLFVTWECASFFCNNYCKRLHRVDPWSNLEHWSVLLQGRLYLVLLFAEPIYGSPAKILCTHHAAIGHAAPLCVLLVYTHCLIAVPPSRDGVCPGYEWPAGQVPGGDWLWGRRLLDVWTLHEGQENWLHGGLHDEESWWDYPSALCFASCFKQDFHFLWWASSYSQDYLVVLYKSVVNFYVCMYVHMYVSMYVLCGQLYVPLSTYWGSSIYNVCKLLLTVLSLPPALVKKLISEIDKDLYEFFESSECHDYLFCHRWLLLDFKREFPFQDSLRIFEVSSRVQSLACGELSISLLQVFWRLHM